MALSRFSRSIAGTRVTERAGKRERARNHIAPHLNYNLRRGYFREELLNFLLHTTNFECVLQFILLASKFVMHSKFIESFVRMKFYLENFQAFKQFFSWQKF